MPTKVTDPALLAALNGAAKKKVTDPSILAQLNAGSAAAAPPGLVPGSREYADWAAAQARAGKTLPQVSPTPPKGQGPQAGPLDFLSQGLSGTNEGMANALGTPVDWTKNLLNLGTTGVNNLTGSHIPQIEHPVGGQEMFRNLLSPTIKPESSDPALQFTRRVGQEVGATVVPGVGLASKVAKPLQMLGQDVLASLGSGTAAATAQQVAPGNPLVEMGAQIVGGMTPGGITRMATRAPKAATMTVDELRAAKNAAYKETEAVGAKYTPQAYENMVVNIAKEAKAQHISPTRHEAAYSFIVDMANRRGKPMTLTELDQLRQEVRRDLITPSYGNPERAADAHFGQNILDHIDDFITTAKPSDLLAGNAADATNAILKARMLNTRLRKTELVQEAVTKAERRAASTGSGGNLNNAIRQNIRAILDNPKKIRAFSAEERQMMEKLVRQSTTDNLLRWVGKFSPGGNGLIGMLEVAGTLHNPALAAMPVAGMVAKGMADRGTQTKVEEFLRRLATGAAPVAPKPTWAPYSPALLAGQTANQ